MKKKLLASIYALCVLCVLELAFPVSFAAAAPENASFLWCEDIVGSKPGNIFFASDAISFTQNVTNTVNEKITAKYTWDITDEAGRSIGSYSRTETMNAKASKTRRVTIDNPGRYGIYTISITEENYRMSAPQSVLTDTYTMEFSVCLSLDESNIDQSFGFNQKIVNGGNYPAAVPLMKNAGAKWHREDVLWQGVEPYDKGTYIVLDSYKAKLDALRENGIETVCILTGRNPLYDNNNCPSSDEAIAAYADFCTYVATKLHGAVDHYEIWNEWNSRSFNPSLEPPETYAKVLKAAYTAIKAVDPDITVIGCDTAGMPTAWIGTVL